jgi:cytochrome P450
MNAVVEKIPAHIPRSLVYDFDHYTAPELQNNPHRSVSQRLHKEAPEVFYTPRNGGYWIVTRAEVAVDMLRQVENFSSAPEYNHFKAFNPPMLPVQADPPDHTEYRRILNPKFAPGPVGKLEDYVRKLARTIIDEVYPLGRCNFIEDVAERFPVTIFLRIAGAPLADRARLVKIAVKYTRSPTFEERQAAITDMAEYLREKFRDRAQEPMDDLLTQIVQARMPGRELTGTEKEGLGVLLFFGGLDTVKSVLSFVMSYLATHPEDYKKLADNPALIKTAMEELLRVSGVSTPERGVTHDLEFRGIPFKKGDRVVFLTQLWGVDEHQVKNPYEVDFSREVSQHYAFGAGPHRCIGSHLARLEFRVFLEEWTRTIKQFGVENNAQVRTAGGVVWTPVALPLTWPVASR